MEIEFVLNDVPRRMDVEPGKRLVDFLREDMGLAGTKEGCGEGECGSCTVIVDGKAIHSCLMLTGQIRGKSVTTVEGISKEGTLSRLQQAFIDHGAVQCGYCTPGMLMSAKALLDANPNPTDEEIKTAMAGNLCRCTGYHKIHDAVKSMARENGKEGA